MEIKWTDTVPETGEKRFIRAEKFAGKWTFRYKFSRRTDWVRGLEPTREIWVFLLDALKARYRRRDRVSDEDIAYVERMLREYRDAPSMDE